MRTIFAFALAVSPAFSQYSYYVTDTFPNTTIDPLKWNGNGLTGGAQGLRGAGSISSLINAPDGTSDYEVKVTLSTISSYPAPAEYNIALRATNFYCGSPQDAYLIKVTKAGQLAVIKQVFPTGSTILLNTTVSIRSGSVIRAVIRSDIGLILFVDDLAWYIPQATLLSGRPGVTICSQVNGGNGIAKVELGGMDRTPPTAISALTYVPHPTSIDLTWNAASDGANGIGIWKYNIYRDGQYLTSTRDTYYNDPGRTFGSSHTYHIYAQDWHGNTSPGTSISAMTAAEPVEPRRIGIIPTGTYWGGPGEQIDVLSGNLNFSLPVLTALGRGSLSVPFVLNYNSQSWSSTNGTTIRHGRDVGYGFGWRLLAGAISPIDRGYIFFDASGGEHILNVHSNGVWTGNSGLYVSYDENLHRVYFNNGTFWQMDCISSSSEADAGTRYPTLIQDSNGNQVKILYRSAVGSTVVNTSARIHEIDDIRSQWLYAPELNWYRWRTYSFTYNSDAPVPHLTTINDVTGIKNYTLSYTNPATLTSPFTGTTVYSPASGAVPMLSRNLLK